MAPSGIAPSAPSAQAGITALRRASGEARTLAASLPRLILDARRIARTTLHGLHGRRRAGSGENFWQYRRFASGEPAQSVDWRRSARDEHLYVREREWEAAHTVWLWPDRSASMAFASERMADSKLERALVIAFALAELLVAGGERVGMPGLMPPTASRNVIERMAQAVLHDTALRQSLPPRFSPGALSEMVVLSDLWAPVEDTEGMIGALTAQGARGTLIQIVDPAEETFPYGGRIEFIDPETGEAITAGRAEAWQTDYVGRVARHRDGLRAAARRRDVLFAIHRTDRPASEMLLYLHGALAAGKGARAQGAGARAHGADARATDLNEARA